MGKALREREAALLTVAALEAELGRKRRGVASLEEAGQQARAQNSETPASAYAKPCARLLTL